MVYSNISVDNNLQILPIKVNSSWFATNPSSLPKTVDFFFKVAASGSSALLAPQGPIFHIIEPAAVTLAAPVPATTTISDTLTVPSATTIISNDKNTTFTPPLVAIVCVAVVTALVAIIALVMAARSRKARSNKSMSTLSTSSTTPMVAGSKYKDSRDVESPVDVASISSVTPLSKKESQPNIAQRMSLSSPSRSSLTGNPSVTFSSVSSAGALSVSDAAFLSDAFRHGLRKPEWGADLAEEGTGLQSVSRKQARIEIMNAKDLLTEGEFEGDHKES
ncbi:10554_t:CDS:2 [Paraglomus brasilianum]|uniref:10554_t:CDS:1 n=1 Tax=Paraglomus brasilianum TaxID=144538 RepID=A0A9N9AUH5_9GLOM|nr:10554_t:CDS:2 [Paraglomus brasilianum]